MNTTNTIGGWVFFRLLGAAFLLAFIGWCLEGNALLGGGGLLSRRGLLQHELTGFFKGSFDVLISLFSVGGLVASVCLLANFYPRRALMACSFLFFSLTLFAEGFAIPVLDYPLLAIGIFALSLAPQGNQPGLAKVVAPPALPLLALRLMALAAMVYTGFSAQLGTFALPNGAVPYPTWIFYGLGLLPSAWTALALKLLMVLVGVVLPACVIIGQRTRRWAVVAWLGFQLVSLLTVHSGWLNLLNAGLGILLLDDQDFGRPLSPKVPRTHGKAAGLVPLVLVFTALGIVFSSRDASCPEPQPGLLHFEFSSNKGATWHRIEFKNLPQPSGKVCSALLPCFSRFEVGVQVETACMGNPIIMQVAKGLLDANPRILSLFGGNLPIVPADIPYLRFPIERFSLVSLEKSEKTGVYWQREILKNLRFPFALNRAKGQYYEVWMESGTSNTAK